jgi:lipopolysaccharide transport system ATP-binding protein
MSDTVIQVANVSKRYRLGVVGTGTLSHDLNRWWAKVRGRPDPTLKVGQAVADSRQAPDVGDRLPTSDYMWALKDLSLEVHRGEILGIIGRNGAGKSTLLKILSRVTAPTSGEVRVKGRIASLLEVGTGFHPELTGRENILLNGAILGMRKAETARKLDEIVAFSGVEQYIDTPVKRYSSGMYVRLAFAVAAHLEPDILLVDEVLAVGDAEFQKKCIGKMKDVGAAGRAVLVVSHQLNNISSLCPQCVLLDQGRIVMSGDTSQVLEHYVSHSHKAAAEVVWDDPTTAPGSDRIRLHAVRVLSPTGKATSDLDIQQEIVLLVSYWNLQEGVSPKVSIVLRGQVGEAVLASVNLPSENSTDDPWFGRPFPVGMFETECRFPANLLNTMMYHLDIHLACTLHNEALDVLEGDILSFTVHDFHGRDSSGIQWQGGVRPKLAWRTRRLRPSGET